MFRHPVFRAGLLGLMLLSILCLPVNAQMKLAQEAIQAFEQYVDAVEDEIAADPELFSWLDNSRRARIDTKKGAILVHNFNDPFEPAPKAMIHDWAAAMFIPEVSVGQVVDFVQQYDRQADIYEEVLTSELLSKDGNDFRIKRRLRKEKVVVVVLDMESEANFEKLDDDVWIIREYTRKVMEVENAGKRNEKVLPDGQGTGFMWRMNSYWRLTGTDDGVYVEMNTILLTRDIPWGLGWLILPFVTSVPQEYLNSMLYTTRMTLLQETGGGSGR